MEQNYPHLTQAMRFCKISTKIDRFEERSMTRKQDVGSIVTEIVMRAMDEDFEELGRRTNLSQIQEHQLTSAAMRLKTVCFTLRTAHCLLFTMPKKHISIH